MKIYGQKGIALEFIENEVFINIYPNTNILVNIDRNAALHLYKLVQKFNYTKNSPQKWGSFWRNITDVERILTGFFLRKNNSGKNGMTHTFFFQNGEDLPQDFANITPQVRLPKINKEIEGEFVALFDVYMKAVVSKQEVAQYWEKEYSTAEIIKKHHRFDELVEHCFEEDKIASIIREVLQKEGKHVFNPTWLDHYDDDAFQSLINNEIGIYSSVPAWLTLWKNQE